MAYKIEQKRMVGFKTHDWHNVLYDLLFSANLEKLVERGKIAVP
jgi:hypothetical protein